MVLSGTSTPQTIRDVLKNGANDFLKKPFVFEEFILKIDLWINYVAQENALREKTLELKFINENLEKISQIYANLKTKFQYDEQLLSFKMNQLAIL